MDLPVGGDLLGQRTRAGIFARLAEHRAPVSTEKLAAELGLHQNGIRRHLELMLEAGLVERSRSKGGRGRPGDLWAIAPDAHPAGRPPSGYANLARWLARAMPAGRNRLREVEKVGQEIGRELAPDDGAMESSERLRHVFASLGFNPVLQPDGGGGFTFTLENCPFRESVNENAEVVCTLHRGITAGLLEQLAPDAELARFEPHDPETAGCVVQVADAGRGGA